MRILIIQEKGRHEKNKEFREALCLKRGLLRQGHECTVWGFGYENYAQSFEDISKDCDAILSLENYDAGWHPNVSSFKGLKLFWSIDSHCVLAEHIEFTRKNKFNVVLNSTKRYIEYFKEHVEYGFWFPNGYPSDLIQPSKNVGRTHGVGFCGSSIQKRNMLLDIVERKFPIKRDIFVIGNDMVESLSSYKIAFNYNIADDINFRTFEATGAGAMLLTNRTPDVEKLFEIGKEIVVYESLEDLYAKLEYYLNNEEKRKQIAKAGYIRSARDHTYDKRSEQLIAIIDDIL